MTVIPGREALLRDDIARIICRTNVSVNYSWEGSTAWVSQAEALRLTDIILARLASKPSDDVRHGKLVAEQTSASFAVKIPVSDFLAITGRDNRKMGGPKTLFETLSELPGVSDVEYNGHFGSNIFYTLDFEHGNHNSVLAAIEAFIALSTTGETKP